MHPISAANQRGMRYMAIAMASFVVNDALVKFVSQTLPSGQLIFIRAVLAGAFTLVVARSLAQPVSRRDLTDRWVVVRSVVDAAASLVYLIALFHIPLPNATAINLASPLFIVVLAVFFYRERVDAARWLAILTGFAGVLMVVQPRADGFNAFAWLCLSGTILHAARDLLTRKIPAGIPSIVVTFATSIAVCLLAGALSLIQGWKPLDLTQLGLLALASAFLACGYYFIIQASRHGEFSVVAPFRYTGLLCALVLGYLVWGDVPNALAWAGIALLIGSGLFMMRRERNRA